MKLEIKHLSAYLPYGITFKSEMDKPFDEVGINPIWTAEGMIKMLGDYCLITKDNNDAYALQTCKPILRPLSQLTKEITHNGEKFVPMIEIVKMIEPYYVEIDESTSDFNVINESTGKDRVYQLRYKNNYNNQGEISMLNFHENEKCLWHSDRIIPIKCHDKLFEWHFDIYGLIENNLAIEKL